MDYKFNSTLKRTLLYRKPWSHRKNTPRAPTTTTDVYVSHRQNTPLPSLQREPRKERRLWTTEHGRSTFHTQSWWWSFFQCVPPIIIIQYSTDAAYCLLLSTYLSLPSESLLWSSLLRLHCCNLPAGWMAQYSIVLGFEQGFWLLRVKSRSVGAGCWLVGQRGAQAANKTMVRKSFSRLCDFSNCNFTLTYS